MSGRAIAVAVTFGCCLGAGGALAQTVPPTARPELRAVRVDLAPVLDGDISGDSAWAAAEAAEGFWQTTPDEGLPASERTTVQAVFITNWGRPGERREAVMLRLKNTDEMVEIGKVAGRR